MHYRNDKRRKKLWQNDHSNVIFLNCIYTQDNCDSIFMKCPAMNVQNSMCTLKLHSEPINLSITVSATGSATDTSCYGCYVFCGVEKIAAAEC